MTIIVCILAILILVLIWKYQSSYQGKLPPAAQAVIVLLILLVAFSRITETSHWNNPTHAMMSASSAEAIDISGFIISTPSTIAPNAAKNVKPQSASGEKMSAQNDDDDENNFDDDNEDTFSGDDE